MTEQPKKPGPWVKARDFKDPSFWGCCLTPSGIGLLVAVGLLYRFCMWASA